MGAECLLDAFAGKRTEKAYAGAMLLFDVVSIFKQLHTKKG